MAAKSVKMTQRKDSCGSRGLWAVFALALLPVGNLACPPMTTVDFEDCLWPTSLASSSGFDWYSNRTAGGSLWERLQLDAHMIEDHTTRQTTGHYMKVYRPYKNDETQYSWLWSPPYSAPERECNLTLWYLANRVRDDDKLSLQLKYGDKLLNHLIQTGSETNNRIWKRFSAKLPAEPNKSLRVTIVAAMKPGGDSQGYFAVDDITFSPTCCSACRLPRRADFECGLHGFDVEGPSDKDSIWKVASGSLNAVAASLKPRSDHTTQAPRGHFLYANSIKNPNKKFVLTSPLLTSQVGSNCRLRFWYQLSGNAPGSLNVSIRQGTTPVSHYIISSSKHLGWQQSELTLPIVAASAYQVIFTAKTGRSGDGDIALDDIQFSSSCCSSAEIPSYDVEGCHSLGHDTRVNRPTTAKESLDIVAELDRRLSFDCNGTLKQWRLHTSGKVSYNMMIWRPTNTNKTTFVLVGVEHVTCSSGGETTIPSEMNFTKGDIIGWKREPESGDGYFVKSIAPEAKAVCSVRRDQKQHVQTDGPSFVLDEASCKNVIYGIAVDIRNTDDLTTPSIPPSASSSTEAKVTPTTGEDVSSTEAKVTPTTGEDVSSSPKQETLTTPAPTSGSMPQAGTESSGSDDIYPYIIVSIVFALAIVILLAFIIFHLHKRNKRPLQGTPTGHRLPSGQGQRHITSRQTAFGKPPLTSTSSYQDAMKCSIIESDQKSSWPSDPDLLGVKQPHTQGQSWSRSTLGLEDVLRSPIRSLFNEARTSNTFPLGNGKADYSPVANGDEELKYMRNTIALQVDDVDKHCTVILSPDVSCATKKHIGAPLGPVPSLGASLYSDSLDSVSRSSSSLSRFTPSRHSARFSEPLNNVTDLKEQLASEPYKQLRREDIEMQAVIGRGTISTVYAGAWRRTRSDVPVAVKTIRGNNESDTARLRFLREAVILGQLSHRNIVELLGVVSDNDDPLVVVELMQDNLRSYLQALQPTSSETPELFSEQISAHLLNMSRDIATGMAYLEAKSFVHRDLAARNIMISSDRVCKIADFGMCREVGSQAFLLSGGKIPIKWTAPEAIHYQKYSSASDVWSFGVVLYELWSLGAEPYPCWSHQEVFEEIQKGYRQQAPSGCPIPVYELMMDCWHPEPHGRPMFSEIVNFLGTADRRELLTLPSSSDEHVLPVGSGVSVGSLTYKDLQRRYTDPSGNHLSVEPMTSVPRRLMGNKISYTRLSGTSSNTMSSNSNKSVSMDTRSTSAASTSTSV